MKKIVAGILLISCIGCLKNQESSTGTAKLAISHYAVNGQPLDVLIDGQKINPASISFGSTSGSAGNIYLDAPAGIHNIVINQGTVTIYNKSVRTVAGNYYTLSATDSVKNDLLNVVLMTDDTTTIDSLAKLRVLHFIPGNDTLSLLLIKGLDTGRIATSIGYMGLYTDASSIQVFGVGVYPGDYRLELFDKTGLIYSAPSVVLEKRKNYSFIATGVKGGTGLAAPAVAVVRNN